MADRTKQHLVIYKGATKAFEGEVGEKTVAITGLDAGTIVAEGDYQIAWSDGTNESEKVDVPAFTVNASAVDPEVATNVTTTPTADGANVTAE
ncbi:hypothetical protein PEPE_0794 [Pediococcus pentosaceus ATCC 25745]|uniref:Major tail protein n=1 Tax=Pediococcus pentosaceus (strain ATCC 25745 / CCUG 21536 / LMG 10740 / 183-1w) TaxID=278197 RepID=Q03G17_PEDPA|nr:hypothetical protein [Pediococcus pentosaceus]ABJ67855.1 hypothetical protein PEPE_0794 [Pediococcus pentosaceus ATCC 25745]